MKLTLKYGLEKRTSLSKKELHERIYETLTDAKFIVCDEEMDKISFKRDPSRFYSRGDKALDIEFGEFFIKVIDDQTIVVMTYHVSIIVILVIIFLCIILSFFMPGGWFVSLGAIIIYFLRIPAAKATCQEILEKIVRNE